MRRLIPGAVVFLALGVIPRTLGAQAAAADEKCLECHAGAGAQGGRPLADYEQAGISAHQGLGCVDCHTGAAELPHADSLGEVDCLACHASETDVRGDTIRRYSDSAHGRARARGIDKDAATCVDCHGKHDIRGVEDPRSMVSRRNIPLTCARCHENNQVVLRHDIQAEHPYLEYEQSVHGKALFKDGLLQFAAVCTDCHGVHDIQAPGDTLPMAGRPATCGKCHITVMETYRGSIHGRLRLEQGDHDSPGCVDCHGEHGIMAPESGAAPTSRANIPNTCSSCHADAGTMARYDISTDRLETYKTSFHGVAQGLGELNAANCASCHGYHEILPASDPRSKVNPANMIKTCGECHPNASSNFVSGKIHVDPRQRSAGVVYYLRNAFIWFTLAVLVILAVWTAIDFSRKLRNRKG
ncbi:MAG: cytochrome c3 family protein [Candidatus Glassbacteria bacterium]|nr:cytochrome c3 family protein [Candidatus Glassbacteria bacterium]